MTSFEQAAEDALDVLGPSRLSALANRLDSGCRGSVLIAEARPVHADAVAALLGTEGVSTAYLRGLARGHARQAASVSVDAVWSGPSTHTVPVRSTLQVLLDTVREARSTLLLMTYSAKAHEGLRTELSLAIARGVAVTIVVETLQGAGSALNGAEPALAFADLRGLSLWHWPSSMRSQSGAKMHAKIAVADQRVLLVSSANLTQAGVGANIEAGTLVRGGAAPVRAVEHVEALQSNGVLVPLTK